MKKLMFCGLIVCAVMLGGLAATADTLSDLGTNAAPGEIPKWDGAQWRNAHDNVTTVNAGLGLSGTMTNAEITLTVTFPPIGGIVSWAKSFPGVPTNLPLGWVECNGQVLSDTNSPLNGQTIPNLNGASGATNRFLRGATTSGSVGGTQTHAHDYSGTTGGSGAQGLADGNPVQVAPPNHTHSYTGTTDSRPSEPPYYEVVWIMRVK